MAPRVTIRSVAEEAGVSISTVSNVLNGRHEQMTPSTRERVEETMRRLGYRPNHLAQSLATSRTATIGLIMSEVTNSLYPPVTIGAEAACRTAGYGLLLANADDAAAEMRAVEVMRDKQVDGLILFSTSVLDIDNDHLIGAQAAGLPIVVINRLLPTDAPIPSVQFDHGGGALAATRHLIELGHRRIAHIAGPPHRFTGRDRRRGYETALAEVGITPDPDLVLEGDYSFGSGERLMPVLWKQRPTAVFVGGDAMALGALRALAGLGVRVPEDLSLVAFGNPDFIRYATPAITTVDLPVAAAGSAAVKRCLRVIGESDRTAAEMGVQTLETTLVVGTTSAAWKGDR